MLNVPQEIKDILHQDSHYKNIRIHFPNGERSDICNDLIVRGSVSFKESLCSQNTLKFGLCEASVFECETVGVGNIKGATIEVTCEVEVPATLTGAEWRTDLQTYIYSIPYGTFKVSECKRQADMIHRKIQAYSELATDKWEIASFERGKAILTSTYSPNLVYWIGASGFDFVREICDVSPHEWSKYYGDEYVSPANIYSFTVGGPAIGGVIDIDLFFEGHTVEWNKTPSSYPYIRYDDYDNLFWTDAKYNYSVEDITNKLCYFCYEATAYGPYIKEHGSNYVEELLAAAQDALKYRLMFASSGYSRGWAKRNYIYPDFNDSSNNSVEWSVPTKFHIYASYSPDGGSQQDIADEVYSLVDGDAHLYMLSIKNEYAVFQNLIKNFPTTSITSLGTTYYRPDYTDVSALEYANALAEFFGIFAYMDRNNIFKAVNIKQQFGLTPDTELYPDTDLYPEGVTGGKLLPKDYQSCWYEDEYTKPFGAVQCAYKNKNNEDCLFVLSFPNVNQDDSLVYDISGNLIIDGRTWTEAQIQSICEGIANNIEGVRYMPVDFVGRGLPYVEAGDTFEILTASNDSITTIVLNRTISGEQVLVDKYQSV